MCKLFFGFILVFVFPLFAQEKFSELPSDKELVSRPYWIDMMQDPQANFFDTQYAFETYWQKRTARKGAGWKPFKRWENFMETRVSSDGLKPQAQSIWTAIQNEMAMQSVPSVSGDWMELGPIALPANGTGQPNGLGRINCIAFHPSHADTFFVGAPAGGIWKTYDGGTTWSSNSDNLSTLGISSILIHPNFPDTMYIGTGDRDGGDAIGLGVFLSTDGGDSWTVSNTGMGNVTVGALLIDPNNPAILLAGTNTGIYRSTDAGANWTSTFSGNVKDLRFMPGNSAIVYASNNGELYRSTDNGLAWTLIGLTEGLPSSDRMVIGVTSADSSYVYALLTSGSTFQGMYLSVDSGMTFTSQSTTPNIMDYSSDGSGNGGQAWYDLCIVVSQTDKTEVYVGGVNIFKSTDSGVTWTINAHWVGNNADAVHADHHVLEYSPLDSNLYSGNDGGVYYQPFGTTTWTDISSGLAIAQCYKLGQSATSLNHVIVGYQDNGTAVYNGSWSTEIGGDGMECIIDYTTTNYMYGELYYGAIRRSSNGGSSFVSIAGSGVNGITESGGWVTPYTLHTVNPNTMFIGYKDIWRSTNVKVASSTSVTWTEISTDLGGTGNFTVVEHNPVDTTIFYASKGASLFRSDNVNDITVVWQTLSSPGGSTIKDIVCHPTDTNLVFIVQGTKIYESDDKGLNWTDITGNINNGNVKNCLVYSPITGSEGLYVGSDFGVYFKPSNSSTWINYGTGLPVYPKITELELYVNELSPSQNTLRASSYGRGLWTTSIYIDPNSPLVADFYAEDTILCTGITIDLIDGTSGVPDSWLWSIIPDSYSFVNGTDSTSQYPQINFNAGGTYTVSLTVSNTNEADTIIKSNYIEITEGNQLVLALETDDYGSETSWSLTDTSGVQIFSGSGYSSNTLYEITMDCLIDSCYTFTINDSYGDGICCGFGSGYYHITNVEGDTLVSGGAFNYTESSEICFTPAVPYIDCSAPIALNCGENYNGTTSSGSSNNASYSCSILDENGPEVVHSFILTDSANITIELSSTEDLNYYLLNSCSQDSCIAYGDSIFQVSNMAPGSYFIVVDGTNGASGSYDLLYHEELSISISGDTTTLCSGDSTLLIGQGASLYSWSPTVGLSASTGDTIYASPLETTTYTLTGTKNGCSEVDSITITVNELPQLEITASIDTICIGDSTILNVTGANFYQWSPSVGLDVDTGNTVIAFPSSSTTYYITGDSLGCTTMDSIVIFVQGLPEVSITTSDDTICPGDSTSLTVVGADSYIWSPSTGLNYTTGPSVMASPAASTLYTVIGSSNGCEDIDTIFIAVNATPAVTVIQDLDSICSGETAMLTVSGAESYTWSPSLGLNVIGGDTVLASPIITTTYEVTGTTEGCSTIDSITVEVIALPILEVSSVDTVLCIGDSTVLTASGADQYNWVPSSGLGLTSGSSVIASPIITTTYYVTGSNFDCSVLDSITVVVNPIPEITVTANSLILCVGDTTSISATGADNYVWEPMQGLNIDSGATVIANPSVTTTYIVTGTSNGCSSVDSIVLEVNTNPIISVSTTDTLICLGDSVVLTASGADNYIWSPSDDLSSSTDAVVTAIPVLSQTYFVSGTISGCESTDSIRIEVINEPLVAITPSSFAICLGDTVWFNASGAEDYVWESTIDLSLNNGSDVYAVPNISSNYIVTGSINGCSSKDTIWVVVNIPPLVEISVDSVVICPGDSTILIVDGASSYQWMPSVGLSVDTGNAVIANPPVTTTYIVTGILDGCSSTDTVLVQVKSNPELEISTANTTICLGGSTQLTVTGASNYTWLPVSGLSLDTGSAVIASPIETTTYVVTGIDNGCMSVDSITIVVNEIPNLEVQISDSSICFGETVMLTCQGADSLIWFVNSDTIYGDTIYVSPTESSYYWVSGVSADCSAMDSLEIIVNDPPILSTYTSNSIICSGDSTLLWADGADSYAWELLDGTSIGSGDSLIVGSTESEDYIVRGEKNGCYVEDTLHVEVLDLPDFDIISDISTIYLLGGNNTVQFESTGDSSWLHTWYFGTGDSSDLFEASFDYYVEGLYTVLLEVTDTNGCFGVDSVLIEVLNNISIEELDDVDWLKVYPNPSSGLIHLELSMEGHRFAEIAVYDARGRQLLKLSDDLNTTVVLDISNHKDGYYVLAFKVGNALYTKMIQKRTL